LILLELASRGIVQGKTGVTKMPELRTRSAGAKVTDKKYVEIEKLAAARGDP
jgi:hypothetical protein